MNLLDRIGVAALCWVAALFICNPFFEGRKRLIAMIACAAIATSAFIFGALA